jgi:hypothetical protein
VVTDEECLDYARECVRLAGLSEDPEVRERLIQMARQWMSATRPEELQDDPNRRLELPELSGGRAMADAPTPGE